MAGDPELSQTGADKLKILVVHEISYVEKVIYEIHEFPELFATRGHEVTFIDYAEGYNGKPGRNPRAWIQRGRVYEEARLTIHSPWLSGMAPIDRLVALFTVWPVLWKLRNQKFDVILNYAVPTYGLQVNLWAKARGIPVVHRALDVSHKIRKSLWNPAIQLVERLVFNLSTAVSANNPAMASYISGTKGMEDRVVAVHYPPTFNSKWKPEPYNDSLAKTLGIRPEDHVVGYLGSFFYFSGLPEVIKSLAKSTNKDSHTKILLVGGGEQEIELRDLAKSLNLENEVIFTGFIDFSEIPKYLSLFSVGINPMHRLEVSNYALPNKVIQYLAMGLPVVSTDLQGLKSSLENCRQVSWAARPEDVFDLATRDSQLHRQASKTFLASIGCLNKFEKNYSAESLELFLGNFKSN